MDGFSLRTLERVDTNLKSFLESPEHWSISSEYYSRLVLFGSGEYLLQEARYSFLSHSQFDFNIFLSQFSAIYFQTCISSSLNHGSFVLSIITFLCTGACFSKILDWVSS